MSLIKQCNVCDKEFRTKPFFVKNGGGKYCSDKCFRQSRKTGKLVECHICGKEVYKQKSAILKFEKHFCSKKCSIYWQNTEFVREKHANWKGGTSLYKKLLQDSDIKKVCTFCKTKNKKVLVAHHIDWNRKNNKIRNLAWLCRNCHFLVHNYKNEREKFEKYANNKKL